MVDEITASAQRRFSAVLLQHASLTTTRATVRLLESSTSSAEAFPAGGLTGWNATRVEYLYKESLYPSSQIEPESRLRDNGYAHDLFVASHNRDGNRFTLIASPYVRLLYSCVNRIESRVKSPSVQFLKVDMPATYDYLASSPVNPPPTRVTMQILNEPGLELVSLSGKNPLHSHLHAALAEVAAPYGVRAEARYKNESCRVSIDRHGNFWWFQSTESQLGVVLSFLSELAMYKVFRSTRSFPLDRVSDEE